MPVYKEKQCKLCEKVFKPLHNRQLFCGNKYDKTSCLYKNVLHTKNLYRQKNKEKLLGKNREYREKHKEQVKKNRELWKKNNYEKWKFNRLTYIHRKRTNGGKFSLEQWNAMKEFYEFSCLSCGRIEPEIKLTMDHIIPVSIGGKHEKSNIQPLCFSCNCSKHASIINFKK